MDPSASVPAAEQRVRQKRGQITYDALIETCFELLREKEFDQISIAELAQKAGYSVGAFYARFRSKDELFDAMVQQHVQNRRELRQRQFQEANDARFLHALLEETVHYYWGRRRFWRASLIRSIREPAFWAPIRKLSHEFADSLIARMAAGAGRSLNAQEEANVRFAVQITFGTINNTIVNRPGPFFMDEALFVQNLVRAFRLVSGYDGFVAARRPNGSKGPKSAPARRQRASR